MTYTADGVFGAESYEILYGRLKKMQDHLNHANDRYYRLRQIVDFYQTLGAEDAKAVNDRYRKALETIIDLDPATQEFSVTSMMAGAAREALK